MSKVLRVKKKKAQDKIREKMRHLWRVPFYNYLENFIALPKGFRDVSLVPVCGQILKTIQRIILIYISF